MIRLTHDIGMSLQAQNMGVDIEGVYTDAAGEYIVEKHLIHGHQIFSHRLVIKRKDKAPIRDWRTLQDIKNAVAGFEVVAIEVYPREGEVTDTGNLYHLWVYKEGDGPPVKLIPPEPCL